MGNAWFGRYAAKKYNRLVLIYIFKRGKMCKKMEIDQSSQGLQGFSKGFNQAIIISLQILNFFLSLHTITFAAP